MELLNKRWLNILAFILIYSSSLFGQLFPNPADLSTGQGTPGSLDPIWTASEWFTAPPADASGATFTPALINNNCAPGDWANPSSIPPPLNNGNWITGQGADCSQNTTDGYRFFRLELNLPPDCNGYSVTDPGVYSLSFSGYVDNLFTDVFLNGSPLGISGGGYAISNPTSFTINGPWQVGINYIDILIHNVPSGSGTNPYGLLLVADAAAMDNNDTDNDNISDLFDECPCEAGNNPVGCIDLDFYCDVDLIRSTFTNAGCRELEGCWDDCSMYFLNPQYLSGGGAQAFAQNYGANLISVQSQEENDCILSELTRLGYGTGAVIWIGFNDEAVEGTFEWYDQSPVTYTNWAPGEPNNSGNEDCTQIYPAQGTWNDLNCNGYNSMSIIEVNLCPQTVVTAPITMCNGDNATIEVESTILGSFPYDYSWSNGSSQITQNVSPAQSTEYIVTTTDRYNCQTENTVYVDLFPISNLNAGEDENICINDNVTITATGMSAYNWDNGLGAGASHLVSPTVTTTYTVSGTDVNGCIDADEITVHVNPLPIVASSNDIEICMNESTTISASGAQTYSWDTGLGSGENHVVNPTTNTTYTVTGTDNNGCVNTNEVTVTVNPLPTITTNLDTTICFNGIAELEAEGASTYSWDNGLGAGATQNTSPPSNTTYTVTGTDING